MSHDLLSKKPGLRNWARGNPPEPTGPVIAGSLSTPTKKIALGAMALGTLAGLAFMTSPWWKPLPRRPDLRRDPVRGRLFRAPGTPAEQIDWSRR
jgi:hypothetical protein